jgi:phosphatidylinositol phospholipase C beta
MLFLNITVKDYVPDKFTELANALADPIRYISNLEKREEMLKSLSDDVEVIMKETASEIEIQKKVN